jgi:hypothetical protein
LATSSVRIREDDRRDERPVFGRVAPQSLQCVVRDRVPVSGGIGHYLNIISVLAARHSPRPTMSYLLSKRVRFAGVIRTSLIVISSFGCSSTPQMEDEREHLDKIRQAVCRCKYESQKDRQSAYAK